MQVSRKNYFDTIEGQEAKSALEAMSRSEDFVTGDSYSPNAEMYDENTVTFVEKHMQYILKHPNLNVSHYLSNLKIMSKKR